MTQFVFANNVNTTLASSISSSATTLTLASSANLPSSIPAGEYFVLTLNDAATRLNYEIVYATAVSGATLTVVRGQEGTSAQSWLLGDFIYNGPTAGQMSSFVNGGVTSFNTRTGAVTLSGSDVDTALGYTPANDAAVVHIAGSETITGSKSFTSNIASGGIGCGSNLVTGADLSKHVSLYGGVYGFNITSGAVNVVFNGAVHTTFSSGAMTTQAFTCTTSNNTASDRRLKRNIRKFSPRPLHRSIPFVSYTLKANGWQGLGSVAQIVEKAAPEHVGTFEQDGKKYLSLNYGGLAYEQALWAGREIDRTNLRLAKLERDLARAKIKPRDRGFARRLLEKFW